MLVVEEGEVEVSWTRKCDALAASAPGFSPPPNLSSPSFPSPNLNTNKYMHRSTLVVRLQSSSTRQIHEDGPE